MKTGLKEKLETILEHRPLALEEIFNILPNESQDDIKRLLKNGFWFYKTKGLYYDEVYVTRRTC